MNSSTKQPEIVNPKIIEIIESHWFDKVNGNSYFSARVKFDGRTRLVIPFQYGYGNHYIDQAYKSIVLHELLPATDHRILWRYCADHSIVLSTHSNTVLKRDTDKIGVHYDADGNELPFIGEYDASKARRIQRNVKS